MPKLIQAKLLKKEKLKEDIVKFSMDIGDVAREIKPGQFIEIQVSEETEMFLRRPISVYNVEKEKGILEVIFRTQGKGTLTLAKKEEGEIVDIIGPLGHGTFKYEGYKNIAILGGGIGVFPLYELAKNAKKEATINTYLGFRDSSAVVLEKEFSSVSDSLVVATDDGSYGAHGFAINILKEELKSKKIDAIFACGPLVMLRAVKNLAKEEGIACQISLEEKMGCGFGVCLGCAVKPSEGTYYLHVCKQGPVFEADKVEI